MSSLPVHVTGLGRRFGSRWVLRGVTLGVQPGEVAALTGANGSGKSTLLRIIGTLLRPNVGTVQVEGLDIVNDASIVRSRIGYLAHAPGLYDDLTARENLRFAADMLGGTSTSIEEALDRTGLAAVADNRVRGFSAGMQRRLAIARLMLRSPRVLLLDEPYSNLDAEGITLINDIIARVVSEGGAALLALHELAPAAGMLDRTLALADGRIAAPVAAGVA